MFRTTGSAADGLYSVGHWLLDQRRYEDAKHLFRTMLVIAPTDERAWLGLGNCHENTCELEKAAQLYALAPGACSTAVRSLVALGRVLRQLDRSADAEAAYCRAAELADTTDPELASVIAAEARAS